MLRADGIKTSALFDCDVSEVNWGFGNLQMKLSLRNICEACGCGEGQVHTFFWWFATGPLLYTSDAWH